VDDCTVQGFFVDGIGHLPRGYVVLKIGYMASADELLQFVHARVMSTDRLLGNFTALIKGLFK
jgi:hypothetical protein